MTRIIYVNRARADRILRAGRRILSRLPGIAVIAVVVVLFYRDPVWPFHMLTTGWAAKFFKLFSDGVYRTEWVEHYLAIAIFLGALFIILGVAFKMGVWNKMFKTLKVRSREMDDKVETELGRAYWIEGWSGAGAIRFGRVLLKALRIADVRIGLEPGKRYRKVRDDAPVALAIARINGHGNEHVDYVQAARPPRYRKRVIFYKATFWPPINPIAPHRSMHRLVIEVPDSAISIHDGTTILVEGTNPKRDLSEDYPTFYLTAESNEYVPLDMEHYKRAINNDIKADTYTTNIASQMDTFLLKDQRKFQEISVPVNPEMAGLVRKREP